MDSDDFAVEDGLSPQLHQARVVVLVEPGNEFLLQLLDFRKYGLRLKIDFVPRKKGLNKKIRAFVLKSRKSQKI